MPATMLMKPLSRPVFLIGFMGCGKSSVGRFVARRLKAPFVDLDTCIEEHAGMSIAKLFATQGEDAFRCIETQVLAKSARQIAIIATGGGVVTREQNRAILKQASQAGAASVVYLRARPETLATRIRRQPGVRPLIDGQSTLNHAQTAARVQELLAARAPLYEECADSIIDTDNCSFDEIAGLILSTLN
ncbi:MAG: shikimate kinase [Abditibacteriota bacterium]|nr:shikimate kinase [Abditibacteriota bacterium]